MFQCYALSSSHRLLPPLYPQVLYLCLHLYSCSMSVLAVASWSTCRFIRDRNVIWYSYLFKNFSQFVVIHIVKGFSVADVDEVEIFLEYPCFLYDLTNIGSLVSGSSVFSKTSLYIWKFSVHILLKPSLKDFEHNLTSMWIECNCTVVWTFFAITFLWDWNEN